MYSLPLRVLIKTEGTVCCVTYVETYLISYHNIYFCEPAIYLATIHIAPISRRSISLNILQNHHHHSPPLPLTERFYVSPLILCLLTQ